jgi:mannan endo-1,6-alpha-mannosidase
VRVQGLVTKLSTVFFVTKDPDNKPLNPNIMVEISCEWSKLCNPDQTSFKAYLSRWMAATAQLAPFVTDQVMPKLQASAAGAAQQCSGGDTGSKCGRNWNAPVWDGFTGVGEQMSALAAVQSNLIGITKKPVTADRGGTSIGDPNAGTGKNVEPKWETITTGSKTGAGILTFVVMLILVGGGWWMVDDGYTPKELRRISARFPSYKYGG